ncbi:MAG: hypothetical protein R2911_25590 [Caldilineaceae bacterium]
MKAGEVAEAFVVRKGELDVEELMAWVAERVSPHKKIRRLEFVEEIPNRPRAKSCAACWWAGQG